MPLKQLYACWAAVIAISRLLPISLWPCSFREPYYITQCVWRWEAAHKAPERCAEERIRHIGRSGERTGRGAEYRTLCPVCDRGQSATHQEPRGFSSHRHHWECANETKHSLLTSHGINPFMTRLKLEGGLKNMSNFYKYYKFIFEVFIWKAWVYWNVGPW